MSETLKELGAKLAEMVRAGIESRNVREERWRLNRTLYKNEAESGWKPYPNAVSTQFNLTQTMLDGLGASVVDVIVSADPWVIPTDFRDADAQEKVERTVQFFLEKSGFKAALKAVSPIAGWSNCAFIKTEWSGGKLPRLRFSVLQPFSTVVYPGWCLSLGDAVLVADSFSRTRAECERLVESGHYGKKAGGVESPTFTPVMEDASQEGYEGLSGGSPIGDDHSGRHEDARIELWDVVYKEGDTYHRCILSLDSEEVLRKDEWASGVGRYAEFRYKCRSTDDGFWPATSVAHDIQGLQLDLNELNSTLLNGARFNAYPTVFTTGTGVNSVQTFSKVEPGSMNQLDVQDMQVVQPKADIVNLPAIMGMYLEQADRVVRISRSAQGQPITGVDTATEAQVIAAGQQRSIDEYIETFGEGVEHIARLTQEILYNNWAEWFPVFGKHLKLDQKDREMFGQPYLWQLNVSSVGSTPQAQMAMAARLYEMSLAEGSSIDRREVESRTVQLAERSGFTNAEGLQFPDDNSRLVDWVAGRLGIEPETVADALGMALDAEIGSIDVGLAGMDGIEGDGLYDGGFGGQAGIGQEQAGGVSNGGYPSGQGAGGDFEDASL